MTSPSEPEECINHGPKERRAPPTRFQVARRQDSGVEKEIQLQQVQGHQQAAFTDYVSASLRLGFVHESFIVTVDGIAVRHSQKAAWNPRGARL